jgi:hypothetical protein
VAGAAEAEVEEEADVDGADELLELDPQPARATSASGRVRRRGRFMSASLLL